MKIFDSHTHINAPEFNDDIPDVIFRARALDVTAMLVIGYDDASTQKMEELVSNFPEIYGAVGCHPEDAAKYDQKLAAKFKKAFQNSKIRVLGEIGLDYHCNVAHSLQKKIFEQQLKLARKLKVPVSIHNRDAFADVYQLLRDNKVWENGAIMHSFNGDAQWAEKFLSLGVYLSYSGVSTFKNASEVREAFKATPLDKVLVETDAPYLAPVPYRGTRNEPGFTRYTLEFLAQQRQISAELLAKKTYENTKRILGIQ
ncbi:TatD family hydrolase [Liquorilactobacillus oeni]|uniref:TatD family deoxyribonuclease n=1 Tax=Liquorilactobacillus oeni DSM 19972 TaxID=1423777 RepID=A0A0R1MDM0_9LACO|nr:TatD family hydrolase [Liquorilactobacillus oeni]KRL06190.1 TatD family deoxyribonuclease [Liquorilactobacillus oeni DSM 19972]